MKKRKDITFIILTSISLILGIAGFIVPPTGQIDGSVLELIALMLAFYVVKQIPEAIIRGKEIKVQHGQTSVTIGDGEDISKMEDHDEFAE